MTFVTASPPLRNASVSAPRFNRVVTGAGPHCGRAPSEPTMARIIVVEQDQLMRALLVEWLGSGGHIVSAYSRIDLMPRDEADLLIVDVVMPRHGGCARLHALQASRPRTPLIAISAQFTAGSGRSAERRV